MKVLGNLYGKEQSTCVNIAIRQNDPVQIYLQSII